MGTAIQNKGWNKMQAVLDEHMPVSNSRKMIWIWAAIVVGLLLGSLTLYRLYTPTQKIPDNEIANALSDASHQSDLDQMDQLEASGTIIDTEQIVSSQYKDINTYKSDNKEFAAVFETSRSNGFTTISDSDKKEEVNYPSTSLPQEEYFLPSTLYSLPSSHAFHQTDQAVQKNNSAMPMLSPLGFAIPISNQPSIAEISDIYIHDYENISSKVKTYDHAITRPFLELGNGIQWANPSGFTQQLTLGIQSYLSSKWSFLAGIGMGWANMNASTNVALIGKGTTLESAAFLDNNNFTRSYPPGTATAQANIRYQTFGHLSLGIGYQIGKVRVTTGVETVYRMSISNNGIIQNPFNVDNGAPNAVYVGNEILEIFNLYNKWDIRPFVAFSVPVYTRYSVGIQYTHGVNGLFRYPLRSIESGLHRGPSLNIRYDF